MRAVSDMPLDAAAFACRPLRLSHEALPATATTSAFRNHRSANHTQRRQLAPRGGPVISEDRLDGGLSEVCAKVNREIARLIGG